MCDRTLGEPGPRVIYVNEAFERMTGYSRSEMIGRSPRILQGPETSRTTLDRIRRSLEEGTPLRAELLNYAKNGSKYWVEVDISAVVNAEGATTQYISVQRDITERKAYETGMAEARQSLQLQATALAAASDGVLITDARGIIEWANPACSRSYGYSLEEMTGRTPGDLFKSGYHTKEFYQSMWETILAGQTWTGEIINRSRAGARLCEELTISPVRNEAGEISHFVAIKRDITARRSAEGQVLADLERLWLISQTSADMMFSCVSGKDAVWGFDWIYGSCESTTGYTKDELLGLQCWRILVVWEDLPLFEKHVTGLTPGESGFCELRIRCKEGNVIWVSCQTRCLAEVSAQRLIGSLRDISTLKRDEIALRESEERLRYFAIATEDAIWDLNPRTGEIRWNERLRELFGHDPETAMVTNALWCEYVHPDDLERVIAELADVEARRVTAYASDYRLRRADGAYARVRSRGFVLYTSEGVPIRAVGGLSDMTDRIAAQERLAQQAALLDIASDAIIVRDLDHRVTYWSQGAERLYGWSFNEMLGRSTLEALYHNPSLFLAAVNDVLRDGTWEGDLEQYHKTGKRLIVHARWSLMRHPDGSPKAVLAINSDVTEKRLLQEQLARTQRLESLGTLAAGIAHDMNNLLAPVVMGVDILRELDVQPKTAKVIDAISQSASRGTDLVRQILSFARGTHGARIPHSLAHIVSSTLLSEWIFLALPNFSVSFHS